jgi:hypothetical protein
MADPAKDSGATSFQTTLSEASAKPVKRGSREPSRRWQLAQLSRSNSDRPFATALRSDRTGRDGHRGCCH